MALNKSSLNSTINSEINKQVEGNANYASSAVNTIEDTFAKTTSKIGKVDGEVLGGVQSLGSSALDGNEVLKDGIGKLTDKIPSLGGTATAQASIPNLLGLSEADPTASAMEAVGGASPKDLQSAVDKVTTISGEAMTDISTFTATIASADELTSITAALPSLEIPSLDAVVGEITPVASLSSLGDGVKDAVSDATSIGGLSASLPSPKNTLSNFGSVGDLVSSGLNDITTAATGFVNDATKFADDFASSIDKGVSGVLQNLAEGLTGQASSFLANIVPGGISSTEAERREILRQFSTGDPTEKTKAIKTLTSKSNNVSPEMKSIIDKVEATTPNTLSDKVANEAKKQGVSQEKIDVAIAELQTIDNSLEQLDTTIGGTVVIDQSMFDEDFSIGQNESKWSGRTSKDDVFTYVASVEELDADFARVERQVTEVIVHATETFTNKDIGAIEINNIHNELGHDGIGYHYVIRRDGRLQRGRPVNKVGEHAVVNGHDVYSIGIVMVGGINVSAGDDNPETYRSSQSFTREQYTTLEKFIRSFYRKYSGGQVFGHNDIDVQEEDPYFDVTDYIESVFRKTNITTDPSSSSPLSPSEINVQ